ncbi:MAG: hypothetical protein AAFX06_22460 [Planctomycetota bacterium]
MFKRLVSTVLLACIVVPTFFWAKDMIAVSVKPTSLASKVYDLAYSAKAKVLDLASDAQREAIDLEYQQIAEDIEATETLIASLESSPGNSRKVEALRLDLADLLRRRERAAAESAEHLASLDTERLEAEKYFLVKLRSRAAKEEWNSVSKIARIESSISSHASERQQEDLAALVNDFIEAVVMMDIESAKSLSTPELASEMSLARIRSMRRNTPLELEEGFELRTPEFGNHIEVWAGDKIASLCSKDGDWRFASAWD